MRFADDFVWGCELKADADRIMAVLPKRFKKYGLNIHPEKSKMIDFKWPSKHSAKSGVGTFDFVGLTHYWGKARSGHWVIKRQTMRKRQARAMRNLNLYCRNNRHDPIREQHKQLCAKLHGLYNYYGVRGNYRALMMLYQHVRSCWRHWLGRRTRDGLISWKKFLKFLAVWELPRPRVKKMV